ncbi:MAG: transglycosylase SLT domain-containing protein [Solirubrobacterales bacterium]
MSAPAVLVCAPGGSAGCVEAAAALAGAAASQGERALLVELADGAARRPTVLASSGARDSELRVAEAVRGAEVAARGRICHVSVPADREGLALAAAAAAALPDGATRVLHLPPGLLRESLGRPGGPGKASGALLRADLPEERALAALAVRDLIGHGLRVRILKRPLGRLAGLLALAGAPLGERLEADFGRLLAALRSERGQALPLAMGATLVLIAATLALVAIAGALTGKGRAHRTADLAALSAARSMRDDLGRLLAPPMLPDGMPNPGHLAKATYLGRARAAGEAAARANGVGAGRLRIRFPDRRSFAPLRARAIVVASLAGERPGHRVLTTATALAMAPSGAGSATMASGGGYSGPLAMRQGEGMRPDVAAAFDRMAVAARSAGVALVINSGYRSDAEQAALFAAHPDPRWVAPPGQSLHRCATELDLGPPGAYGWLAANARRFGFVQRYSWEAWHFGFAAGPAPCSAAANSLSGAAGSSLSGAAGDGSLVAAGGLPAFVPARFRRPLLLAASRWNVSAPLLAAQLMAESNFDPHAQSGAGAQGIAQFMPSTAAAYGLGNPFDPEEAIEAQAHLMSDLLRRFGSPSLALAAYNAGPAAVAACRCIPPIPETQAYVARILGLLDGAGALAAPPFEVRLID